MKDHLFNLTLVNADFTRTYPFYDYIARFSTMDDDAALLFAQAFKGRVSLDKTYADVRFTTNASVTKEECTEYVTKGGAK